MEWANKFLFVAEQILIILNIRILATDRNALTHKLSVSTTQTPTSVMVWAGVTQRVGQDLPNSIATQLSMVL